MSDTIGRLRWVIPEGYIPPKSHGPAPEFTSHEAFCVLNTNFEDAHLNVTIFYADREPVGPYCLTVPARRTRHFRFNNLEKPAPIPEGTSYSSLIESDVPVIVQHSRLDSRQSKNALLSTIAYPCAD
ncbi:MAG: sensory rhodopsin transducer [Verrucomicrobia bacterium]|nr:sensory rhodopsin transducer [Verrucomicrobiota bacterium]